LLKTIFPRGPEGKKKAIRLKSVSNADKKFMGGVKTPDPVNKNSGRRPKIKEKMTVPVLKIKAGKPAPAVGNGIPAAIRKTKDRTRTDREEQTR